MNEIFGIIALLFTLIYYFTVNEESCWYRRYLYPAMFIVFGLLSFGNVFLLIVFFASAYFSFYGFKGLGIKLIEEQNAKKLEETKNGADSE